MNLLSLNIILPILASFSVFFSEKLNRRLIVIVSSLMLLNNIFLFYQPNSSALVLVNFLENYQLSLSSNYLANIFALMVTTLYFLTNIYSFYYLDIQESSILSKDLNPKIHFFFTPIAIMAALNIGYSSNLITLFVFYEILTLSTYPLVIQSFSEHAQNAGKTYLWILFGSSSFFLIIALIFIDHNYGSLSFKWGGVFSEDLEVKDFVFLLICFVFGFSKTAILPLYKWLPKAMVAPVPVSALLHAVAVVKSGIFALTKIFIYLFGLDYLSKIHQISPWAIDWLTLLACFTIIFAGIMACLQHNLKKILAYSTISQLSYMILALTFTTNNSVAASFSYMLAHSVAKITLFFSVGIIYLSLHETETDDLRGIIKIIPLPVILFIMGALSIIGLPLSVGFLTTSHLYKVINCSSLIGSITMSCLMISKLLACFYFFRAIFTMLSPTDNLPICYQSKTRGLSIVTAVTFLLSALLAFYLKDIELLFLSK